MIIFRSGLRTSAASNMITAMLSPMSSTKQNSLTALSTNVPELFFVIGSFLKITFVDVELEIEYWKFVEVLFEDPRDDGHDHVPWNFSRVDLSDSDSDDNISSLIEEDPDSEEYECDDYEDNVATDAFDRQFGF